MNILEVRLIECRKTVEFKLNDCDPDTCERIFVLLTESLQLSDFDLHLNLDVDELRSDKTLLGEVIMMKGNGFDGSDRNPKTSSSIRSYDKDEQYKLISRPIHTINTNLFDLLAINPVQFTNLRYIRYKTQIRSQHQDQTKKDTNNASVAANIQKIDKKDQTNTKESEVAETVVTEKPSLYQRFKQTYKQHGKILIAVHLCTSAFWFSSLYLSVRSGLDIVPYLEKWNISEKVISPFRSGGLGSLAVTFLLYKMIAPVRYASTLGGTNLAIKYLRREGKMKEIPQEDRLRSLYKEGKENLKTKSKARIKKLRRKSKLTKGSKNDSN
uniref:DUF1279 domain-containing protein n=1 Tax=Biomphalaria glabrata TaxID=6526 RepID=A0A2C9L784_BIOGL